MRQNSKFRQAGRGSSTDRAGSGDSWDQGEGPGGSTGPVREGAQAAARENSACRAGWHGQVAQHCAHVP